MPRWSNSLDDQILEDADTGFRGFVSRVQPDLLDNNVAAYAENMRFEDGAARTRRGVRQLSQNIDLPDAPLLLPFTLGDDVDVVSITRSDTTATVITATAHGFESMQIINIDGADQAEYNGDFIITVSNATTFTYEVAGSPATPATGNITANGGPVLYADYQDGAFAAALWSPPTGTNDFAAIATAEKLIVVNLADLTAVDIGYPGSETIVAGDEVSLVQAFNRLILFRGPQKRPLEWDGNTAEDMTLMADTGSVKWNIPRAPWGLWYQNRLAVPLRYAEAAIDSITSSGTTVTVATDNDHGLLPGERITISGATETAYNGTFEIATVTGDKTFTYTAAATPSGSPATGDPVLAVERRDELIFSDILDLDTYDPVTAHFRINSGAADELMGLFPWLRDQILVFYRYSIHLITGIANIGEAGVQLVAREVGCSARKSIAGAGPLVFFLSGRDIQTIEAGAELFLRWRNEPVSRPIEDITARINLAAADNAAGVYFDNRYYLAVPLDDSVENNAILVFNTRESLWESVDILPPQFRVRDWIITDFEGRRRLLGSSPAGGLFLIEGSDTGDEIGRVGSATFETVPVRSTLVTRRYGGRTGGIKRWTRADLALDLPAGADVSITPILEDPDGVGEPRTLSGSAPLAGDPLVRMRIGSRGRALQLRVVSAAAPTAIRSTRVEATFTGRGTQDYA